MSNNAINDVKNVLEKHNMSIIEFITLYINSLKNKKLNRLTQCYEDNDDVWCYFDPDGINPCDCGSNCYH